MSQEDLNVLLAFFKALSDESRLKIIGLLSTGERSVGELAALLDLKEPTISHHLARLKNLDLVTVRAEGNNRYYALNRAALEAMNHRLLNTDQLGSWVDSVDLDAYDKKVLEDYFENGRLIQIPVKQKKLLVILRWLAEKFEPGVRYTEKQVNAIIGQYADDYVTLRRELINFHFLNRESGGEVYWRAGQDRH